MWLEFCKLNRIMIELDAIWAEKLPAAFMMCASSWNHETIVFG